MNKGTGTETAHSTCIQGDEHGLGNCNSWRDVELQNQMGAMSLRTLLGQIQAIIIMEADIY